MCQRVCRLCKSVTSSNQDRDHPTQIQSFLKFVYNVKIFVNDFVCDGCVKVVWTFWNHRQAIQSSSRNYEIAKRYIPDFEICSLCVSWNAPQPLMELSGNQIDFINNAHYVDDYFDPETAPKACQSCCRTLDEFCAHKNRIQAAQNASHASNIVEQVHTVRSEHAATTSGYAISDFNSPTTASPETDATAHSSREPSQSLSSNSSNNADSNE